MTNQSFANLCLFLLIVTDMEANKDFLILFVIFDKISFFFSLLDSDWLKSVPINP